MLLYHNLKDLEHFLQWNIVSEVLGANIQPEQNLALKTHLLLPKLQPFIL